MAEYTWKGFAWTGSRAGLEPLHANNVMFFGDSITDDGTAVSGVYDPASCIGDGSRLLIQRASGVSGVIVGDYIRLNNAYPTSLNKVYRVAELSGTSGFYVDSDFIGTVQQAYLGDTKYYRLDTNMATGYSYLANYLGDSTLFNFCGTTAIYGGRAIEAAYGSTLTDARPRIKEVQEWSILPDIVHILIGTNDITRGHTNVEIVTYYDVMYQELKSYGVKRVILGCPPARSSWHSQTTEPMGKQTADLAEAVKAWAADKNDVLVVDYYAVTKNSEDYWAQGDFMQWGSGGGLHFSPYGNLVMARELRRRLLESGWVTPVAREAPPADDWGWVANPGFNKVAATGSDSRWTEPGTYPVGHTCSMSSAAGAATASGSSKVVESPEGNQWVVRSNGVYAPSGGLGGSGSKTNYGMNIYIRTATNPGTDIQTAEQDCYVLYRTRMRLKNISGKTRTMLTGYLSRNGVRNSYAYMQSRSELILKDSEELDLYVESAPMWFKAGEKMGAGSADTGAGSLNLMQLGVVPAYTDEDPEGSTSEVEVTICWAEAKVIPASYPYER